MAPVLTSILPVLLGSIGTAAAAAAFTAPLVPRDDPVCDLSNGFEINSQTYSCYVEHSAQNIVGAPQTVSGDVGCDGDGCMQAISSTYTVEQSFEFDIGIDSGVAKDAFTGSASIGASWSWDTSEATSITTTFTLKNGDAGHLVFWPYLHQSCGALASTGAVCNGGDIGCYPLMPYDQNNPNACGTTPLLLAESANGKAANGITTFCYTYGPRTGQGCSNPPGPPQ